MAMFGEAQSTDNAPQTSVRHMDSQIAASTGSDVSIAQSVLTPAVSTMIADGSVSEFELVQISNLCAFSPIFLPLGADRIHAMVKVIIDEIGSNGHAETIQRAAGALSPKLRETALCFAMRIALADGHVDEKEMNSLAQTGHFMEIEPSAFDKILSVVVMMQRPATA